MKKALKVIGWMVLTLVGLIVCVWAWAADIKSLQWIIAGGVVALIAGRGLQEHEERKSRREARLFDSLRRIEKELGTIAYLLERQRRGL